MSEGTAFDRANRATEDVYLNVGPNLSLLCSYYDSIADVCRRLGMNRQQFNKYLNSSAFPSRKNLTKICNFFGVTEAEILYDQEAFSSLVSLKHQIREGGLPNSLQSHLASLLERSENIDRYQGFFFRYFPSYAFPGKFIKALGYLGKSDSVYYWKCNERLKFKQCNTKHGFGKWRGVFLNFADRLYLVEYDSANMTTPV